jgi:hypothetical protein
MQSDRPDKHFQTRSSLLNKAKSNGSSNLSKFGVIVSFLGRDNGNKILTIKLYSSYSDFFK